MSEREPDHLDILLDMAMREAFRLASTVPTAEGDAVPVPEIRLPEAIGPYAVRGIIDRGGMGVVLRAFDTRFGREVAIKLMASEPQHDATETFAREGRTLAQLEHHAIVPVHDLGVLDDGRPYFVMRALNGATLAELLEQRVDPAAELTRFIRLFDEICRAMAYAHEHGVTHRDLKPSNIMIGDDDEVFIIDWGLSSTSLGPALPLAGTPAYMPPEQATGRTESADPRNDVFALGAILCEILTGAPPYVGDIPREVLLKATRGWTADALERLDRCTDPVLAGIAKRCLEADPEARPSGGREVANLVAAYFASIDDRARRLDVERAEHSARIAQRRRSAMRTRIAAAVAIVAMAMAAASWLRSRDQARAQRNDVELAYTMAREQTVAAEALHRLDPDGWNRAVATSEFARERSRSLAADDDLVERIAELADRAHRGRAQAEKHRRIRTWLQTACHGLSPDGRTNLATSVFADLEIDIGADPADVADALRGHPLREELIGLLDEWIMVPIGSDGDAARRARLGEMANLADGDETRRRVRSALLDDRDDDLVALVRERRAVPFPAMTWRLVGAALDAKGHRLLAIDSLRRANALHPSDGQICHDLGKMLLDEKRYAEAVAPLSMAVATRPHVADSRIHLAEALRQTDRHEDALLTADAALAIEPTNAWARLERAMTLRSLGARSEGRAALDEIDREHLSGPQAIGLSYAFSRTGRLGAAIETLAAALQREPDSVALCRQLGLLRLTAGQLDEAETLLRAVVARAPADALSRLALGRVLTVRRSPEATVHLAEARRRAGDDADVHFNIGQAYRDLGLYAEAIAAFTTTIALAEERGATTRYPVERILAATQELRDVAARLNDVSEVEEVPLTRRPLFARVASQTDRHFLAAALNASLVERIGRLPRGHGFDAARSAAIVGLGAADDAPELTSEEREGWLHQSQRWLGAELEQFERDLEDRVGVSLQLVQARHDPAYAPLQAESAADDWGDLWEDIDDLLGDLLH